MLGSRVVKRYAKALFNLSLERKLLNIVEQDLGLIREMLDQSEELQSLIESPVIRISEKRQVFTSMFEKHVHGVTYHFLNLLLDKNRENILPWVIDYFKELLDERNGILRGRLITAHEFTDEQLSLVKEKLDRLTEKNVILKQQVDIELIGGFIIHMKDTVIDISLKNQLTKMRRNLTAGV